MISPPPFRRFRTPADERSLLMDRTVMSYLSVSQGTIYLYLRNDYMYWYISVSVMHKHR